MTWLLPDGFKWPLTDRSAPGAGRPAEGELAESDDPPQPTDPAPWIDSYLLRSVTPPSHPRLGN